MIFFLFLTGYNTQKRNLNKWKQNSKNSAEISLYECMIVVFLKFVVVAVVFVAVVFVVVFCLYGLEINEKSIFFSTINLRKQS